MTSDYGYGSRGAGNVIPPNADLTFEAVGFVSIYFRCIGFASG